MKQDLDFDLSFKERFIARCSCIVYNKTKDRILFFKVEGRDYYMLPGGRIEYGEDSLNAIKREIKEELGYNLNYVLKSIQEIFLKKDNKNIMQYCFCYEAIYDGIIENQFKSLDNDNQTFYWIDVGDVDNINIVPRSNINVINDESLSIVHSIENNNMNI